MTLRLAIGREGIGIELAQPVRLGCLSVTELIATLPGTRFPIDVSGGVPRFRHRRGVLQRVALELDAREAERWAAPRLRGLVGARAPQVWLCARAAGATVCVFAACDVDEVALAGRSPIIAFEVRAMAVANDLVFVVERARGSELPATASAVAIACMEALFGSTAVRSGAMFIVQRAAGALAFSLLPRAGARVPESDGMRWTSLAADGNSWILQAGRSFLSAEPSEDALRAREVAGLLRATDDALLAGDESRARSICLDVLDRAPGHVEIARRLVEIDARAGGRAEAVLGTLAEVHGAGDEACFGTTPGEMHAVIGDRVSALASYERAAEVEPAPALAARAFELASEVARDPEEAARLLDRALERAPRSVSARWKRAGQRLELGRLEDALADVEHLEAMARGARLKAAIWLRAGVAWRGCGHSRHAGPLFERALRYSPDEPAALAGLAAALLSSGHRARGVAALARALELADGGAAPPSPIRLELARALAEHLDDLPTAIAHASAVGASGTETVQAVEAAEARGLEGRWRARLGDRAGASLAFARLRELAVTLAPSTDPARAAAIAGLLREAAEMERTAHGDVMSAQRHLAAALRLRPHDAELRRTYGDLGAVVGGTRADGRRAPGEAPAAPGTPRFGGEPSRQAVVDDEAGAAVRVDELTRRLQGDPRDEAISDELASLLESLGRGHELLALMSARIEEAGPEVRPALVRRARAAISRLVAAAKATGRSEEASFYIDAMGLLAE